MLLKEFPTLYFRVHQKFLIPGSLVVNSGHHHLMKSSDDSAADLMAVDENSVILPSALVEDKTSLRYRSSDTSKLQVTWQEKLNVEDW